MATVIKAGRGAAVTVRFHVTERVNKASLKAIKSELPKKSAVSCIAAAGKKFSVSVVLTAKDEMFLTGYEQYIRTVADGLRASGASVPSECPLCKEGNADAYALQSGAYMPVHRVCVEEKCKHAMAKIENRRQNGSYLLGFAGALLGAIVGMLPTFISIFFFEYIILYLCLLIPLASYGGYRLFMGKPTKGAAAIILLCSVLQIFLLEQALWYANIVRYFDVWPSVWDSMSFYFEVFMEDVGDFLPSIGQEFLFVGIGIVACFGMISRTAAGEIEETMSVLETLRDRRAGAAAVAVEPPVSSGDQDFVVQFDTEV